MTEPTKPKHAARTNASAEAAPRRSAGGSRKADQPRPARTRFAWIRTTRWQVALAVAVLAVAVLARFLVPDGDSAADRRAALDALPGGYGAVWTTQDGSSYRLTLTPVASAVLDASPSGCVATAGPGRANARFQVRIDNFSSREAPVPRVEFGANVTSKGTIDTSTAFRSLSRRIDVSPQAAVRGCDQAWKIGPDSRDTIAEGGSVSFTGLIGGLRTPVGRGLVLIAEYDEADPATPSNAHTARTTAIFGPFVQP
ncbi:MAG: hypothetical protein JWQ74_2065 [Marmoricola sp.]|nr:hypothetical protein [Marmoricola sp.]